MFSFRCTDFAGAKYALCPPDPSLCTAQLAIYMRNVTDLFRSKAFTEIIYMPRHDARK